MRMSVHVYTMYLQYIIYVYIKLYIFMYPIWKCQREVNIQWVHDPLATGIRYDEYSSRPFSLVP